MEVLVKKWQFGQKFAKNINLAKNRNFYQKSFLRQKSKFYSNFWPKNFRQISNSAFLGFRLSTICGALLYVPPKIFIASSAADWTGFWPPEVEFLNFRRLTSSSTNFGWSPKISEQYSRVEFSSFGRVGIFL